jgi:hypothetical protein
MLIDRPQSGNCFLRRCRITFGLKVRKSALLRLGGLLNRRGFQLIRVRPDNSRMRKFSFWLCFCLVAVPTVIGVVAGLLSLAGVAFPGMMWLSLLLSFGSLVPPMLAPLMPSFIVVLLGYVMLFLVLRRAWLLVAKREGVPGSFTGAPKVLAYVGAWSFILAVIGFLLSIALRAGSGVPAGLLLLPAVFCVPWAFFLTEVRSFRRAQIVQGLGGPREH